MKCTMLLIFVAAAQTIPPKMSGKADPGEYPRPSSVGKMPESMDRTGIPTICGMPGKFGTTYNGRKDCGDCAKAGSTGNSVWAKHWLRAHNVFRCMHDVPPVKWDPILECWMDKWINLDLDAIKKANGGPHSNAGTLPKKGAEGISKNMGSPYEPDMPNEVVKGLYYHEWKNGGQFEVGSWPGSSGKKVGHFANIIWRGITHIGCARGRVGYSGCMGHNTGNPDARPNGKRSINWKENYQPEVRKSFEECEKEVKGDGTGGTNSGASPASPPTASQTSSTNPPRPYTTTTPPPGVTLTSPPTASQTSSTHPTRPFTPTTSAPGVTLTSPCPNSEMKSMLTCRNGELCNISSEGWSCCVERGGRERCPAGAFMCARKHEDCSSDHCCYGSLSQCQSVGGLLTSCPKSEADRPTKSGPCNDDAYECASLSNTRMPCAKSVSHGDASTMGREWNDQVESVRVKNGCKLQVYVHSKFKGRSKKFPSGDHHLKGAWARQISSYKCHCSSSPYFKQAGAQDGESQNIYVVSGVAVTVLIAVAVAAFQCNKQEKGKQEKGKRRALKVAEE